MANPFLAFSEYFEKANEKEWAPDLKNNLVELLQEVDHSLREKLARAHALHKIRVLMPEKANANDPSFAKACQAILNIGKSEVYRSFKAGKFLHLLEEKKVPKDRWPTRESHLRKILVSEMPPDQQVDCWLKVANRYRQGRMTAKHINEDVNAILVD